LLIYYDILLLRWQVGLNYYYIEKEKRLLVKNEENIPEGIAHFLKIDMVYADNIEKLLKLSKLNSKEELKKYLRRVEGSPNLIEEVEEIAEQIDREEKKEVQKETSVKFETQHEKKREEYIYKKTNLAKDVSYSDIRQEPPAKLKKEDREEKNPGSRITITSNELKSIESNRGEKQKERKQGERAEELIEEKLRKILGDRWKIEKHAENVDILLIDKKTKKRFYIEVKSSNKLDIAEIHWSESQVQTAGERGDKYILAVVFGVKEEILEEQNWKEQTKIVWIVNPYEGLKQRGIRIEGKWEWKKEEKPVNQVKPWERPSDIPKKAPNKFIFVIRLGYSLAKELGIVDTEHLKSEVFMI